MTSADPIPAHVVHLNCIVRRSRTWIAVLWQAIAFPRRRWRCRRCLGRRARAQRWWWRTSTKKGKATQKSGYLIRSLKMEARTRKSLQVDRRTIRTSQDDMHVQPQPSSLLLPFISRHWWRASSFRVCLEHERCPPERCRQTTNCSPRCVTHSPPPSTTPMTPARPRTTPAAFTIP